MKRNVRSTNWYSQRGWAFIWTILALATTYFIGSRSIDTGSLWEYLGMLAFLIISVKLAIQAVKTRKEG